MNTTTSFEDTVTFSVHLSDVNGALQVAPCCQVTLINLFARVLEVLNTLFAPTGRTHTVDSVDTRGVNFRGAGALLVIVLVSLAMLLPALVFACCLYRRRWPRDKDAFGVKHLSI